MRDIVDSALYGTDSEVFFSRTDSAECLDRPVAEKCAPDYFFCGYKPPLTRVGRVKTVVPHYDEFAGWDDEFFAFTHGAAVHDLSGVVDESFIQFLSVEINIPSFYHHFVSRYGDDALDEIYTFILRRMEYDDVAAARVMEPVADFISEYIFAVLEVGYHRVSLHLMRLEEENIDDCEYRQRHNDRFYEIKEKEP